MQNRNEWFNARIGKTVYRTDNGCECQTCKDVLLNGLKIADKMHADYLEMCENDLEIRYFDTIEERNEFEQKINPS